MGDFPEVPGEQAEVVSDESILIRTMIPHSIAEKVAKTISGWDRTNLIMAAATGEQVELDPVLTLLGRKVTDSITANSGRAFAVAGHRAVPAMVSYEELSAFGRKELGYIIGLSGEFGLLRERGYQGDTGSERIDTLYLPRILTLSKELGFGTQLEKEFQEKASNFLALQHAFVLAGGKANPALTNSFSALTSPQQRPPVL